MSPRKRAASADPVVVEDETTAAVEQAEPETAPAVTTRPASRGDRRQRYREV